MIEDKSQITPEEVDSVKQIFRELLEKGEHYDVDEIEYWFENEGSWKNKPVIVRLTNLSHYIQDKFEQTARLRMISDNDDSCSCGN